MGWDPQTGVGVTTLRVIVPRKSLKQHRKLQSQFRHFGSPYNEWGEIGTFDCDPQSQHAAWRHLSWLVIHKLEEHRCWAARVGPKT